MGRCCRVFFLSIQVVDVGWCYIVEIFKCYIKVMGVNILNKSDHVIKRSPMNVPERIEV